MTEIVTADWEDRELAAVGRYPESGFEWRQDVTAVDPADGIGPWLCLTERGRQRWHRYPLLRQRRVLTEFVQIAGVPSQTRSDAILEFANRRGWLGQRNARGYMVVVEDKAGERFEAEGMWHWRQQAALLAGLVECNELIPSLNLAQPQAVEKYESLVHEIEPNFVMLTYGSGHGLMDLKVDSLPGRRHRGDIMAALVREAVERKLTRSFSLVFRPERLVFMPASLLEALYLIFAVDLVGRRPAPRVCLCGCGEEFYPRRRDHYYLDQDHGNRDRQRRKRGQPSGQPPNRRGQS